MKKSRIGLLPILVGVAMVSCASASEATRGRAISMRMLEKALKERSSRQAMTFYGVTRLYGFFVDPETKDIILVGQIDPSCPSLQVDDFIVALRYAHRIYARREGHVLYYTPPGCSIDPDPEVLQELRQVGKRYGPGEEDRQAVAMEWEAIGSKPQRVRVMGVPFDTHFAKVMVDADYYMKRLSNGSVDLGIDGFSSIMSMRIAQAEEELASGIELSEPQHSLNRFWFCPGEVTYEESDGLVVLRDCQVKLLTEEEFLTSRGEVEGLGRPSALARSFAESFTARYQEIAEARPIYKELEALFRFTAIATLMKESKALPGSGHQWTYLLSQHKVQTMPVSRMVTGQTRVVELQDEKETPYGTEVRYRSLMSCGGVDMDIRPRRIGGTPARNAKYAPNTLRKVILRSRPTRTAVYWDFSQP